jgi:hypothetical protein
VGYFAATNARYCNEGGVLSHCDGSTSLLHH